MIVAVIAIAAGVGYAAWTRQQEPYSPPTEIPEGWLQKDGTPVEQPSIPKSNSGSVPAPTQQTSSVLKKTITTEFGTLTLSYSAEKATLVGNLKIRCGGWGYDDTVKNTISAVQFNFSLQQVAFCPDNTPYQNQTINVSAFANSDTRYTVNLGGNIVFSGTLRPGWGCKPVTQGVAPDPNNPPPTVCGYLPTCSNGQSLVVSQGEGTWTDGSHKGTFTCSSELPPSTAQ